MLGQIKLFKCLPKNDLTLVEIHVITLKFGSDACQINAIIVQVNTKSAQKMSDICYLML